MGLKDKMLKKSAEITANRKDFEPLELAEGNVQAIYTRCLATEEEKQNIDLCHLTTIFYESNTGINSGTIWFSKEKLKKNTKEINYLFGQLKAVHVPDEDQILTLQDAAIKYDKTAWTSELEFMFKLLNLACAVGHFPTFTKQDNIIYTARTKDTPPTLSPKDPAFPIWWEAHKAEWED